MPPYKKGPDDGNLFIGHHQDLSMDLEIQTDAARLVRRLREAGLHITLAESCTGGLLASTLTDIAGASEWFNPGSPIPTKQRCECWGSRRKPLNEKAPFRQKWRCKWPTVRCVPPTPTLPFP